MLSGCLLVFLLTNVQVNYMKYIDGDAGHN